MRTNTKSDLLLALENGSISQMIKSLYEYKNDLQNNGIFFSFSGPISQDLIVELGSTLKRKMKFEEANSATILKVFSMVVEQTQNIIRYSAERIPISGEGEGEQKTLSLGIIAVGYEKDRYFVLAGNLIENCHVERIRNNLDYIQTLDRNELKQYYKDQRKKDPEETSKGAGLGFIDMARKSSQALEYDFHKVDEDVSFFSLKTVI